MYVDLLTRALGKGEEGHRSNDLLLADLVHSRARLRATEEDTRIPVAEALARELSYDAALIRLCESLRGADRARLLHPPGPRARPAGARAHASGRRALGQARDAGAAGLVSGGPSAGACGALATLNARTSTFVLSGPATTSHPGASSTHLGADPPAPRPRRASRTPAHRGRARPLHTAGRAGPASSPPHRPRRPVGSAPWPTGRTGERSRPVARDTTSCDIHSGAAPSRPHAPRPRPVTRRAPGARSRRPAPRPASHGRSPRRAGVACSS